MLKARFLALISVLTLLISCVISLGANGMFFPTASASFTIPCTINTYGSAWNGTLVYALYDYNAPVASGNVVVMNTDGQVFYSAPIGGTFGVVKEIAPYTLLYHGDPNAPTYIWNYVSNTTTEYPNIVGSHDVDYDPVNHTFLTLWTYVRNVNGTDILFDKIVELDANGNVLWSWDTYGNIPLYEADPSNPTAPANADWVVPYNATEDVGQTVVDFTHANALIWDYNDSIVYLNLRHTNTFYKIDQHTGDIIWACGEFGNFTLSNEQGAVVSSLWYHSHDLEEIAPDLFTMFDNDYHNLTNANDDHSRMIEVALNETTMTARVIWSWEAPTSYWSEYFGSTDELPNGDWLGDFGTYTKTNDAGVGAVLVEVNQTGQMVRTWTFPAGWGIYRAIPEALATPEAPTTGGKNSGWSLNPTLITAAVAVIVATLIICLAVLRVIKKRSGSKTLATKTSTGNGTETRDSSSNC